MEENFTKLVLNTYDNVRTTKYRCVCNGQTSLQFGDFEKHWDSDFSNLEKADFVGAPEGLSYIDFYCPLCNVATTIQYSLSVGGQHGEFWFTIESVVVGENA